MASITEEIVISAPSEIAWAMIRDFGGVQRLVPGFLVDCRLDGDARIVTFASGRVARELLVDIDDKARNAALQVFAEGENRCRVVWIIDVLPNTFADVMRENMQNALASMKRSVESSRARPL